MEIVTSNSFNSDLFGTVYMIHSYTYTWLDILKWKIQMNTKEKPFYTPSRRIGKAMVPSNMSKPSKPPLLIWPLHKLKSSMENVNLLAPMNAIATIHQPHT